MIRSLTAAGGALALLLTLGCGTKGPLYLPQPAPDAPQQTAVEKPPEK
jgi:predicted small lipoprotein YifL